MYPILRCSSSNCVPWSSVSPSFSWHAGQANDLSLLWYTVVQLERFVVPDLEWLTSLYLARGSGL